MTPETSSTPCPNCGGYGEDMNWLEGVAVVCRTCGGTGDAPCPRCNKPLEGKTWTTRDGKTWHWDCFGDAFVPPDVEVGPVLSMEAIFDEH